MQDKIIAAILALYPHARVYQLANAQAVNNYYAYTRSEVNNRLVAVYQELLAVTAEIGSTSEKINTLTAQLREFKAEERENGQKAEEYYEHLRKALRTYGLRPLMLNNQSPQSVNYQTATKLQPSALSVQQRADLFVMALRKHFADLAALLAKEKGLGSVLYAQNNYYYLILAIQNYTATNERRRELLAQQSAASFLKLEQAARMQEKLLEQQKALSERNSQAEGLEQENERARTSIYVLEQEIKIKARQLELLGMDIEQERDAIRATRDQVTDVYYKSDFLRRINACGAIRDEIEQNQLLEARIERDLLRSFEEKV